MLQNQSFETVSLQEELEATQTELFVLESVNVLTEAEDAVAGEEQGSSKLKEYAQKAKEFFIKIAKAIAEAFKKFTAFFVEAFNKLQARTLNVKKYIAGVKSSAKLEEAKSYSLLAPSALKNLQELAKPDGNNFDRGFERAKSGVADEKNLITETISTISDASKAAQAAEGSVREVKAAAKVVDQTNKKAQLIAKQGVEAAAKGDKEAITEKKRVAGNASKAHSLARTAVSKAVKLSNQTLATAFTAAKAINSAGKKEEKAAAEK
ncbi:hypothetical protein UFVDC4_00092 [Staphylococcus phage vB_SauM-UFV_DC4]|nr:hypothetical protein UFVDC4_00092 [Staphylococcus phage vB_SauM-UFV_DC4]